jgi:hypothetical protein
MISQVSRFSDILNKSKVDANMKCWQIYGDLNFCDYISAVLSDFVIFSDITGFKSHGVFCILS